MCSMTVATGLLSKRSSAGLRLENDLIGCRIIGGRMCRLHDDVGILLQTRRVRNNVPVLDGGLSILQKSVIN